MSSGNGSQYILQVEDNPDDVELTKLAHKKSQMSNRLVVVSDGEEALDFLFCRGEYAGKDPDDFPAIILLDLKLPRVDGLEVLKQIRADRHTQHIPVVILTSSMEQNDQSETLRLGANSYIRKPTGLTSLIGILHQIKEDWLR
jgi:two-component system, response regulator